MPSEEHGAPDLKQPPAESLSHQETMSDPLARSADEHAHVASLHAQGQTDREIMIALIEQGELDRAQIANLQQALVAARRIGAAMGILMHTHRINEGEAFDRLKTASQTKHRKLRDVADEVLFTGVLEI